MAVWTPLSQSVAPVSTVLLSKIHTIDSPVLLSKIHSIDSPVSPVLLSINLNLAG